jgi:shikimate dehydrogenase
MKCDSILEARGSLLGGSGSIISSQTRLLAVIGHPVRHSLSPVIHNAAFRAQGVDAVYLAFDVRPEEIDDAVAGFRAMGLWGANVTVPHKEKVLELMDELDAGAAAVGAVNTIVTSEAGLKGYNTDITGFEMALSTARPAGVRGTRCFVAGAGGAARAAVAALLRQGAGEVLIHNRTRSRAERLCVAAKSWGEGVCRVVEEVELDESVVSSDVVVNATTIGLDTTVKKSAVLVDNLHSHQVVMDLVYGPQQTHMVREAAARGAIAVDGSEMLLAQAAVSFRLWTGLEAPLDVMRSAMRQVGR